MSIYHGRLDGCVASRHPLRVVVGLLLGQLGKVPGHSELVAKLLHDILSINLALVGEINLPGLVLQLRGQRRSVEFVCPQQQDVSRAPVASVSAGHVGDQQEQEVHGEDGENEGSQQQEGPEDDEDDGNHHSSGATQI